MTCIHIMDHQVTHSCHVREHTFHLEVQNVIDMIEASMLLNQKHTPPESVSYY